MTHELTMQETPSVRRDNFVLFAIAAALALVHVLTNGRYGFHRDELQTLTDALHMEWGFVAYPPFTPFLEKIGMSIFGISLVGLRMFSVIAQSAAVIVTGLMARELGGARLAQVAAALAVTFAPLAMFEGTEFQYSSFDYLWWTLIAYFVIRLLKSDDPRWCVAVGATLGFGFMTKYSIGFYLAGIIGGLALTQARKFLLSGWFWAGVTLTALICMPNVIWQVRHGLVSLHFLQFIHARDVRQGRAQGFLTGQLWLCTNVFSVPLWFGGLIAYFRDRKFRMLGWMYVIPLALFVVGKGRNYYLAGAYPMLMAMGGAAGERWVTGLARGWRWAVEGVYFTGLTAYGLLLGAILVPVAASGPLRDFALKNNGDLREEFGWEELVAQVAAIRDSLPAAQREGARVLVGNYGEGGAIDVFGRKYRLGPPIMVTNSGWYRSFPTTPPSALIVLGWSQRRVDEAFVGCRVAGKNANPYGVKNEESEDHPDIFVCDGVKGTWEEFWRQNQWYG